MGDARFGAFRSFSFGPRDAGLGLGNRVIRSFCVSGNKLHAVCPTSSTDGTSKSLRLEAVVLLRPLLAEKTSHDATEFLVLLA